MKKCKHFGKNNPNWRGGRSLKKHYCIDCGKRLGKFAFYFKTKRCQKCASKGKNNSNFKDGRCKEKHFCIKCGNKICLANWYCGNRLCISCHLSPNKPERLINKILNNLFPKNYKFVGNGKFKIERFNPDFINIKGQKKIIEFNGDHWHKKTRTIEIDKRKLITYAKLGYKTLVIWEHELKNIEQVINKIKEFHYANM